MPCRSPYSPVLVVRMSSAVCAMSGVWLLLRKVPLFSKKLSRLGIISRSDGTLGLSRKKCTLSNVSCTTCLTPLPRWQVDELLAAMVAALTAAAGAAVLSALPGAALAVPARPSMPSRAAELAAVTRTAVARRRSRPAFRRLSIVFPLRPLSAARRVGGARAHDPTLGGRRIRAQLVSICSNLIKDWLHSGVFRGNTRADQRECVHAGRVADLSRSLRSLSGEGRDLAGQGEVVGGQAARRVRAERQRHLVPGNRHVRVVAGGLGQVGAGPHVQQGVTEVGAEGDGGDLVAVAGPGRHGGQLGGDLVLGQKFHGSGIPFPGDDCEADPFDIGARAA